MSSEDYRLDEQRTALIRYINQKLIVRQLTQILKSLAMPVSGLKNHLQKRLIERIDVLVANKDFQGLNELKRVVYNPEQSVPPQRSGSMTTPPVPQRHLSNGTGIHGGGASNYAYGGGQNGMHTGGFRAPVAPPSLHFRTSPFFEVLETITPVTTLPVMSNQRNVISSQLRLSRIHLEGIQKNGYRCMLYCTAGDASMGGFSHVDVEFPQQIEVRVNQKAVAGKLKGLKNKPGTTHPLDVTDYIQVDRITTALNQIMITYALNQKQFSYIVNLVRKHPSTELAEKIRSGKFISKETVLEKMRLKAEDSDVIATSTVLSLKCPLSTLRIKIPIRSNLCRHNQCFDALSFLQLQEQAPTWNCPVCNHRVLFEQLVVDRYVEDILHNVPSSTESVVVDPVGNWMIPAKESVSPPPSDSDDDDNDLIEIKDEQKSTPKSISLLGMSTPISREQSAAVSRPGGGSSNKRPASAVIDLTLSDDDGDSPPPPPKRHQSSSSASIGRLMTPNNQNLYAQSPPLLRVQAIPVNRTSTPVQQQQLQQLQPSSGTGTHSDFYLNALLKYSSEL